MYSITPELPISQLEFTFQALDTITIPAYSGMLWHSVFGRSLRALSCIAPGMECQECMLLQQCDYPYLFRRIAPADSDMLRGKEIPVPHIFRVTKVAQHTVDAGEQLTVSLVMVGQANHKITEIIRAMYHAGAAGLGKQRQRCQLQTVKQTGPNNSATTVMEKAQILANSEPMTPAIPSLPDTLRLTLITPYKPPGKHHMSQFELGHFLMAMIRRISLLQYFYTGKRLQADFSALKKRTERVQLQGSHLQWERHQRYSARHGEAIDVSGWLGTIELDARQLQDIWPYLWLGQWLSVGKNASMGFGLYQLSSACD
jgi:hypothetical protein